MEASPRHRRRKWNSLKTSERGWVRGKYRKCSTSPFPLLFTSLHFHHVTTVTPLTSSPVLFPPSRVVMTKLFISNVWHFALCRSPERMNAPRFSKEHLVISQHFPPHLDCNTLGMGINTCCTLTHTERRGAFEWGRGSGVFRTHHPWAEERPAAECRFMLLLIPSFNPFRVFNWLFWVLTHQRPTFFLKWTYLSFNCGGFTNLYMWINWNLGMRGHSDWVLFIQSLLCGIKSRCCANKMWPCVWMCVNEGCGSLNVKMWHSEEEKEGFWSISSPRHWTFLYSDAYVELCPYVLCLQWCSCSFAIIIYINYISFQSALELAWLKPETIGVFPFIFFDSHFEDSLWGVSGNGSDLNKPLIRTPHVVFTHVDKQLMRISADGQQLGWWKHAWFALSSIHLCKICLKWIKSKHT